jgi:ATP-binding cassette subfamily B protein
VSLIPRLYEASSGQVLVDGVDVREYERKSLGAKLGYVPQSSVTFAGTIRSNVAFGDMAKKATDEDVMKALETAQAAEFVNDLDEGVDTVVQQGGRNLSGGQRQRLSIARAICRKPEIFVLDDSFSALDFKTDKAVREALKKNAAGSTFIIVAQRIGTIMDADLIVVLDEGKVVGRGKHSELMKTCELYREMAESQMPEELL